MASPSSSKTIVLITGANSGVGYAIAKVLVSTSPKYHVIMGSRNRENGRKAQETLEQELEQASTSNPNPTSSLLKGTLSTVTLDVTDQASVDAAVRHVTDTFGRLDVLVNNAGVYVPGKEDGIPNSSSSSSSSSSLTQQLEQTLPTNVIGVARVTESFNPLLIPSESESEPKPEPRLQSPYLLHITSSLGSLALAEDLTYSVRATAYRASKAALNMLAVQDAKVLAAHGVKVFAVCPGLVRSNLRGKDEQSRSAGGAAQDPEVSGQLILDIVEGKRDSHVGKFVYKDGVRPW
ncbi:hypothetical protein A1O3_08887 [Capronia epimyces CBS 606.96]|uniref:Uncharacterized protein n=1 Tax=Capronia epimyces CBS 606.96 TaxID=1182542 RepID=W9XQ04_9EURO|nr:uncharacterized protein A1O3_08887 [Capronia epimyces CBS 606.96]EXJ79385.1 hypothetical protein A1O3_08887 [Capronia epimyces CBS 606.96]